MKACLTHTAVALVAALLVHAPGTVRAQSTTDQPQAAPQTPVKEPESGAPIEVLRATEDGVEGLVIPEGELEMQPEEPGEAQLLNDEASAAPEPAAAETAQDVAIPETEWGEAASIADPPSAENLPPPTEVAQPQPTAPAPVAQPAQPPQPAAPAPVAQPATPPPATPAPVAQPAPPPAAAPAPVAQPAPPAVQRESAGAVSTPAARRPTIDTAPLMARGQTFLRQGDIASARLFFERAAESGDAAGMIALARTFDPIELRRLGVLGGIRPDAKRAMELYQSAAAAGDTSAQQSMTLLSEWIARSR